MVAELEGNTADVLNDLVMETEEWKLPLEDWLVATDRGYRINKAMLAEHVASDEGGNLICVTRPSGSILVEYGKDRKMHKLRHRFEER